MEDRELLDEFVRSRSQGAFQELVTRHLPVVYSAARRMVRDPHLAEEVAQSVFTTLAQKAASIRPPQVLGGWLYNTTRHLAMHAIRTEQRRREREQTAFAMQSLISPTELPEIAEHLEPAMAELDAEDRDALVLRYLGNRGLREVGAELGVSEEAARKRVNRALERLRTVLEQRHVSTTTVLLATALAASVIVVPNGLGAVITTTALAPTATITLTNGTLLAMKTKAAVATISAIAAVLIFGTGALLAVKHFRKPHAIPGEVIPVKLANDSFVFNGDERFVADLDSNVKRTPDSDPAGHIKSVGAAASSADFLASLSGKNPFQASRSIRYFVNEGSALLGKRIRVSGWIKSKDVAHSASATLLILNAEGHIFAEDNMTDRAIHGTTDWQQVEFITDVPAESCVIYFGPALFGTGEIWTDDFQIELASPYAPITDDRKWHFWSQNPGAYSADTNSPVLHDGHTTLCLAYTQDGDAPRGSWMWWGEDIRDPDKYRGHTVRMTVWTKMENVTGGIHPNLRPKGPNFKLLAKDSLVGAPAIKGTSDWTLRTTTCLIPKGTQCLDTGIYFGGSGKVWVDMQSLKYEIIK